jgi:hypothetical protein
MAQPQGLENLLGCGRVLTTPVESDGLAPSPQRFLQLGTLEYRLKVGGNPHAERVDRF